MMRQLTTILIICSLFKLSSCSGQESKTSDKKVDEMQKTFEEFEKRPIYKVLTADIIRNVKDENLELTIIDNILTRFNKDFSNEEDVIKNLTEGQKAVYVTWIIEAEVNNGGFNQFYYNSNEQIVNLGENAFETIGAIQFANLVREANSIYAEIKQDLEKYNDGTIESFSKSYEQNPLNDLDDKFYNLYKDEQLAQIRIKYIRDNVMDFVTD